MDPKGEGMPSANVAVMTERLDLTTGWSLGGDCFCLAHWKKSFDSKYSVTSGLAQCDGAMVIGGQDRTGQTETETDQ